MASGAERGLATKLLSQKGRGSAVPNELAAAARRVLDGSAQPGDMDAIRKYFNVGRSHAGKIRGGAGALQRLGGTAVNLSRDFEMLTHGSSVAGARIVATAGLDLSREIVKNRRALIKIGEGVAESVGANPALASRFFNSLSRIAKVGGVVTATALAGFAAANKWIETLKAGSDAELKMDMAFFTSGSRRKAIELKDIAQSQISQESLLHPNTGIGLFDDLFAARQLSASEKRMNEMQTRTNQARTLVRPFAAVALAQYASTKGKHINDLTQEEVNDVLDKQAGKFVGVSMDRFSGHVDWKKSDLGWGERALMKVSPHYNASKYNEWAQELQQIRQDRFAKHQEAKAWAEQETKRRMSTTDRLNLLQARQEATANFSAFRSRHRAVMLD